MKSLLLALTLTSSFAMATETSTFTVEGMHCSSCKKIITKSVCENEAIAKTAESCEVKLTNAEKQTGELNIVAKKDMKLDEEAIKTAIAGAGEGYKVSKVEVKVMLGKDLKEEATAKTGTTTETTTTTVETVKKDAAGKTTKEVKKTKKVVKKATEPKKEETK